MAAIARQVAYEAPASMRCLHRHQSRAELEACSAATKLSDRAGRFPEEMIDLDISPTSGADCVQGTRAVRAAT